jgi:hypothetical protein
MLKNKKEDNKYPEFKDLSITNEEYVKNESLKHKIIKDSYVNKKILLQNENHPHLDIDLTKYVDDDIDLDKLKSVDIMNCVFRTIKLPSRALSVNISSTYTDELVSCPSDDVTYYCELKISNSAIKNIDFMRIGGINVTLKSLRTKQFLLSSKTGVRSFNISNSFLKRLKLTNMGKEKIILNRIITKNTTLSALFLNLVDVEQLSMYEDSTLGVIHENDGLLKELEIDSSSSLQTNDNENYFNRMKAYYDNKMNYITADKYYVQEMNARLLSSKSNLDRADKFLYRITKSTSNFGQSFITPLVWLLSIMILAHLFLNIESYADVWKYKFNGRILWHELKEFMFLLNPLDSLFGKFDTFHPMKFILGIAEIGLLWSAGVSAKRKLRR